MKILTRLKKFLLKLAIFNIILLSCAIGIFAYLYNTTYLDVEALTANNNGIIIYSSDGSSIIVNTNRSIAKVEDLPEYVKYAFIDTEDKRFYNHTGYDTKRIIKAAIVNTMNNEKSQGASTISQQLIKNALLDNKKTYSRKLKELILSIKMEKQFSKDQILEMYLNTIYFGSGTYGIDNASQFYFNKSAIDLTPNEACILAGIIKSPNYYNPISNKEKTIERRNLIAKNMLTNGHIDKEMYNNIINSTIELKTSENNNAYNNEAIIEACSILDITERELIKGGYSIYTFQDTALQNSIDITKNKQLNSSSEYNDLDSLSIVASNDGKILAYSQNGNHNLHNIRRQSASLLKPLAVYLPCFQHNILSPADLILDEAINYSGYSPENADKTYHGYVNVREAIANSYNIPAVKALDYVGLKRSKQVLERLGLDTQNRDMNLTLALGATSNGIKLTDLTNAYLTIANGGTKHYLTYIDKIVDKNGNTIYTHEDYNERVLDEGDCYLLTTCLKESVKSGTARRLNDLNLNIASKTGTASVDGNNTDIYNVAYSTEHTILTWVGRVNNQPLPSKLKSSNMPTDINKSILSYLYRDNKPKDFNTPDNIKLLGYSKDELDNNHRLILDKNSIYKDYFKTSNLPPSISEVSNINSENNKDKIIDKMNNYITTKRKWEV